MKIRGVLAFAALLLMTTSCSSGGGSPDDATEALNPETEPVTVTTTVDESRAVSARIGPDGGTLTTTGADGSRYVLEIPADALFGEIEITMTPIESMEGLPLSEGLAAGVQLAPDGLSLYDFVNLTIEPAKAIPVEQQLPIGSSGEEGAVYIPLIDFDPDAIRLKLLHFSSAGVSKGYLADLEPVRQRLGGDIEARISSLMTQEMARARQAGEDPDPGTLAALDKMYRDKVLNPRVAAAGESCAAGRLAQDAILYYGRQSDLRDLGYDWRQAMTDVMPKASRVCVREEYELCRDEHIVHRMIPIISSVSYAGHRFPSAEMDKVIAETEDLARKCLTFEVEFESTARIESDKKYNESEMESTIEISYEPGSLPQAVTGSSALVNLSYEVSNPEGGGCTTKGNRGGGTFEVFNLYFEVAVVDKDDRLGYVKDIWLTYAPGISTETITSSCPDRSSATSLPSAIWSNTYMGIHQSEVGSSEGQEVSNEAPPPDLPPLTIEQLQALMQSGGQLGALPAGLEEAAKGPGATFVTKVWEMKNGELFAQKEWDLAAGSGGASMTEEGSFKLYHRPQ
jgi:hypothetical protein